MSDPINEIFEFAGNAAIGDIFDVEAYLAASARLTGHVPGLADQRLENAALRQLSRFCGGVAQFIAQRYAPGVVDDGDRAKIVAGLEAAVLDVIGPYIRLAPNGGIIDTTEGLAVDPSKIDATAQLRYHGLI